MRFRVFVLGVLLVIGGAALALAKVSVDYDRDFDFSGYETWSFKEGTPANDIVQARLEGIIEAELSAKGLRRVESGGDFLVVTHAETSTEQQVDVWDTGAYGYRRRGWYGGTSVNVRDIDIGTIVVDIVDVTTNELVWRGVGTGTLAGKPDKNEKKMQKGAKKMFKNFPPTP